MKINANSVVLAYPTLGKRAACQVDLAICLFNQFRWGAQEFLNPLFVAARMVRGGVPRRKAKKVSLLYERFVFTSLVRPALSVGCPHLHKDIAIFPCHKLGEARAIVFAAYHL